MNQTTGTSQRMILSQAQLAVLTRHLLGDELRLNGAAHADLGVDAAALRAAEAALLGRGRLLRAADGSMAVADEPAAVLATTIVPERVAIVRTRLPDGDRPPVHFSWAGDRIIRNEMSAHGLHIFSPLDTAAAADQIIAAAGVPADAPAGASSRTAELEALVASMQSLTMLMVVEQPAQPHPLVRNLSWLSSGGGLWLVDNEQAAARRARRVDRLGLRQAIDATIEALPA